MRRDFIDVFKPYAENAAPTFRPPSSPRRWVSHFSEWVFNNSGNHRNRRFALNQFRIKRAKHEGQFSHRDVEVFREWCDGRFRDVNVPSTWEILFADDHFSRERTFTSRTLTVGGRPLCGRPDVILRDSQTGRVLIIERKFTDVPVERIPADGWPNLRAQLWCYAWMDEWLDAPDVLLVGQIWSFQRREIVSRNGSRFAKRAQRLYSEIPRFRRSDAQFHDPWRRAFEIYGGRVNLPR